MKQKFVVAAMFALLLAACGKSSTTATTATTAGGGGSAYGQPGDASKADRTIAVHITPSLTYDPAAISVTPGETVVFKVTNDSTAVRDFVLGDSAVQDAYEKTMMDMGTGQMIMPDHSNILNVQVGVTKQLAWTFPSTIGATVIYGSHQPGDYAKGLKGLITVEAAGATVTTMGGMGDTTTTGMGTTVTTMGGMTTTTGMGSMPGMGDTTTTKH